MNINYLNHIKTFLGIVFITITCLLIYDYNSDDTNNKVLRINDLEKIDQRLKSEKSEDTRKRQEYLLQKRGGHINYDNLNISRQFMRKRSKQVKQYKDGQIDSWQWQGPGNIGGRVKGVAIHPTNPNSIFIASESGGMIRSLDGGTNWSIVSDYLSSLSISDVIYHPNGPDTLYASTGNGNVCQGMPGDGIFKSINGGTNWTKVPDPTAGLFNYVNDIEIDPSNNLIYAVTTENFPQQGICNNNMPGGFYISSDHGNSFTRTATFNTGGLKIAINPNDPMNIIVGCANDLYVSGDGGITFARKTTSNQNELPMELDTSSTNPLLFFPGRLNCTPAFAGIGSNKIYVSRQDYNNGNKFSELYLSTDKGLTWSLILTDNWLGDQGWHTNAVWVNPNDDDELLLGGVDMFKVDASNSPPTITKISDWSDYHNGGSANSLHADQNIIVPHPNYSSSNPVVYIGNDGGVQRSNDIWNATQNSGWINMANSTMGITQFYGAAVNFSGSMFIGGSQDNSFVTGTNSSNWFQFTTGDGGYVAIDYNDDDNIYATTQNGRVWRSDDNGSSFTTVKNASTNSLFIAPFIMDKQDPTTLYLGENFLNMSNDQGDNWNSIKAVRPDSSNISAICALNPNLIWIGYANGVVEFTQDGGNMWSGDLTSGIVPNRFVTDIDINPTNPNEILVSFGGYQNNQVFVATVDNSNNVAWTDISSGLPPIHVNSISWNPVFDNFIYAGTDQGLFASDDQGQNWNVNSLFANNEGPVYTEISEIFWQGTGSGLAPAKLCVATYGRGIFRTSNSFIKDLYVDKNHVWPEVGTFGLPFNTFEEAEAAASDGTTIYFKSVGDHDEFPPALTTKKRIQIKLANGDIPIVIK